MKRFLAWWHGRPQLRVQFVRPGQETNPLAEQAIESLKSTVETLHRALGLVNRLQVELGRLREELAAYAAAYMEPEAQVAELERLRGKETPSRNV
jgi:hypothetical protein